MNKYVEHFKTISKHKAIVMYNCMRAGIFWRGLMHDNSKFGPTEFFSSARYFQGTSSPIDAEKAAKGYSLAWQHHKGHNPHHWEYWIDNVGTYANTPCKVPYKYVVEMVCDWIGAGKVYSKEKWTQEEPLKYYEKVRGSRIIHPATEKLILFFLNVIDTWGLKSFYTQAKSKLVKDAYEYYNEEEGRENS